MDELSKYSLLNKLIDKEISKKEITLLENLLDTDEEFATNSKKYIDNIIACRAYEKLENEQETTNKSLRTAKKNKLYIISAAAAVILLLISMNIIQFTKNNILQDESVSLTKSEQKYIFQLKKLTISILNKTKIAKIDKIIEETNTKSFSFQPPNYKEFFLNKEINDTIVFSWNIRDSINLIIFNNEGEFLNIRTNNQHEIPIKELEIATYYWRVIYKEEERIGCFYIKP